VGAGAGTSLPGRLIERLSPGFIGRAAAGLPSGTVVVSGTNGKTTTAPMIQHVLRCERIPFVANASGANMMGGVAGALLNPNPATGSGCSRWTRPHFPGSSAC
jgi:hypothetical protein